MMNARQTLFAIALAAASLPISVAVAPSAIAATATAEDLNRDADQALQILYRTNPAPEQISKQAKAVVVYPSVVKAGLVFGGAYGEGVLKMGPQVVDYYNSFSGSWGLQAGAQSYGYALFLMNDKAIDYIRK